jgi:glutaredoxin 3
MDMYCCATLLLVLSTNPILPTNHPQTDLISSRQEKPALTLYYTSYCPYSRKVLGYLKQVNKQLPMKDLASDPSAKEELKKVGGKMQVPCLVIDNQAIYESGEIIQWLSQHLSSLEPSHNQ